MSPEFFTDKILLSALYSSVIAQVIKTAIDTWKNRRFNWRSLFRGAGMPSSHTATVVGLAMAVYLSEGFTHLFFVTLVLAAIVVRDVMGDKVFATHQEKIINDFLDDLSQGRPVQWKHLIGHTGVEVTAGIIVGLLTAWIIFL